MFESITKSLTGVFERLRARGLLTEATIRDGIKDVRMALLEADVHFKVVKDFTRKVTEKAIGEEVIKSVRPEQQIVKIVQDEMTALMGPSDPNIPFASSGPTVIMLVGLQGCGKTTMAAKLALFLKKKKGRLPLLVAADIQRPAAVEQLKVLGESIDVPVYSEENSTPPRICAHAWKEAKRGGYNTIILDTAGRLHIDQPLMDELRIIRKKAAPNQIYLVADAMTGQDAVNSASEFNAQLPIDGLILTKLDGDARGGAALSIKAVTGKPVKFVGVGEKIEDIEEFHPDRMAQRILGMGDITTLVEKAQEHIDEDKAKELQQKLMQDNFTLEDFLFQFEQLEKMGSVKDIMGMIPGASKLMGDEEIDESQLAQAKAILQSMTPFERAHPDSLDGSRRFRIARGSASTQSDVNMLLKQFEETRGMMRSMIDMGGMGGKIAGMQMRRMKKRSLKETERRRKDRKKKKKKKRK
jgi:signal recognition particle subunit SRP54